MSALLKEALVSTKADVIKEARKNEKSRVTRKVDRILTILKVESGSYDHNSISKIELGQAEVSLKEAFKNVEKYNPQWFDQACEISQEEVILIKGKESFENSKKVVQATLDADVNRKASTVKEESHKKKSKASGESIPKETFENAINAQTNKTKTELVEPQKSQCLYGSKLMSLKDESSDLNLKCEEENTRDDPRSCQMF